MNSLSLLLGDDLSTSYLKSSFTSSLRTVCGKSESESDLVYLTNVQIHLCQHHIYVKNKEQRTIKTIPIQGTLAIIH